MPDRRAGDERAHVATAPVEPAPLDEVMLAMDVVDTIRHRELVVARELQSDERRAQLQERLKALYAAQGIDVPDHVLAEGVAALEQDRFHYEPPAPGIGTTLARVYVSRRRWGRPVLAALSLLFAALLGYQVLIAGPRAARLDALPDTLQARYEQVVDLAEVETAEREAAAILASGRAALDRGEPGGAEQALGDLDRLRARLEQEYDLRIVSRPGELSGVWRVPDDNPSAQNFYIIVEAIDPQGRALTLPIRNEEDGRTHEVDRWGLRVDTETFRRIQADKSDDGILQADVAGRKRPGYLEPEYTIETTGAAITDW